MPLAAVYVNDFPLSNLNCWVEDLDGWLGTARLVPVRTPLVGRTGELRAHAYAQMPPRQASLQLYVQGATMAALTSAMDELEERLFHSLLEVRFADQPDKFALAICEGLLERASVAKLANPWRRLEARFSCPDPYRYSVKPTVVSFGAIPVPCPLGSAPSAPRIRIMGPGTDPIVSVAAADGTLLLSMAFTISLGTNDFLEINCDTMVLQKSLAGVVSSAITTLNTSSGFIDALEPFFADYAASSWPTLAVSAGQAEAMYRRAWL